jgi:predicted lipoprotein
MPKPLKYTLVLVVAALLAYKSVYIKKLDAVKAGATETMFDAGSYVQALWKDKLPVRIDSAIELATLVNALQATPDQALQQYTNAMAIGNYRYAMVKTSGIISNVGTDDMQLLVPINNGSLQVQLATEFVYGNALRDASKLLDIKDFANTAHLNALSEALNDKVRKEVVPPFKAAAKKGDKVMVVGAVEINRQHLRFDQLEIIPLQLQIQP